MRLSKKRPVYFVFSSFLREQDACNNASNYCVAFLVHLFNWISNVSGCLHDGIRYGSGSAMMGSRRCEYCYCISGSRRCVRPKCLLPLPGCTPLYAPHSCCPVAYNCTRECTFITATSRVT